MNEKDNDLIGELESILFSSGRWMNLEELSNITEKKDIQVKKALAKLKQNYDQKKDHSLILLEEENLWKLTVKQKYAHMVKKVVNQLELPTGVMETLAVIAFKYPVLQADVIKIRTNKAYDHLGILEQEGFIAREKFGRTKKIRLTQKFFDYFDIPEQKVKDVFSRFESVEKSIEKQELEKEKTLEKNKEIKSSAQKEIDITREKLGKLETYDSIADNVGVDPEEIDDEDLEVDIPRAKSSKEEKDELENALQEEDNVEEENTDESTEDTEKPDDTEEEPPTEEENTDESTEDTEKPDDTEKEEKKEDNYGTLEEIKDEEEPPIEEENTDEEKNTENDEEDFEDVFKDDEIDEKVKNSEKILDDLYAQIDKSKDDLNGKMNKGKIKPE